MIYDLCCQARDRYLCLSSGKLVIGALILVVWVSMHPGVAFLLLLIPLWLFLLVQARKSLRRAEHTIDQLRRREDAGARSW